MLVGRDVRAIHRQRGIAVADADVAEELIVGAIFLDDVNHVVNRILATFERNGVRPSAHQVAIEHFLA